MKRRKIIADCVECFGISCIHHVEYDDGTKDTFIGNVRIPASLKRFLSSASIVLTEFKNNSTITLYK